MTPAVLWGKSSAGKPDNILPHRAGQDGHHRAINAEYGASYPCLGWQIFASRVPDEATANAWQEYLAQ